MPKVTIYTTPTCVYCRMTKAFFKEHNVAYEERDVLTDMTARDEMISKSHQMGVPVIDVDGQIIVGFDEKSLSELLQIK
ncbi:MAG: glutaredoxin family protein [Candidatus Colwellbacteria bacterium]|nr:glutaredoxin family protein [Candidatus Colwellbacteria bacterium]